MTPPSAFTALLEGAPPALTMAEAATLLAEGFGLSGRLTRLSGERDLNIRVDAPDGRQYVLKITDVAEDRDALAFQQAALRHLERHAPTLPVPRVVASRDREDVLPWSVGGRRTHARLLTFMSGTICLNVAKTPRLRRDIGRHAALLDRALARITASPPQGPAIWDLQHAAGLRPMVDFLRDRDRRAQAHRVLDDFDTRVAPVLGRMPAQVIHGDLNQNNVLVDPGAGTVSGLIDFGDLVSSPRVNELAVTIAHLLYAESDPLAVMAQIVAAYHDESPLDRDEIGLVFDLVRMRLLTREIVAAWRGAANPGAASYNEDISQMGWEALDHLDREQADEASRRNTEAAFPPTVTDGHDRRMASIVERRERLLGPTYKQFYQSPFMPVRGDGVWVFDDLGRRFLDAYNNVPHVGHCHPHVVEAATRQMRSINTNTRYLHETILDYAEKLAGTLPAPLDVCLFVCTGTEANELAWRIAKANTGHDGALVTGSAFHGNSTVVSAWDTSTLPRDGLQPWVATVPAPKVGGARGGPPALSPEAYAACFDAAADRLASRGHEPAAFIACPVFASDGLYSAPAGYLAPAISAVRRHGALVIADEVQSALGRTGTHMWGFQHAGIAPDIVTMAKPMGNGLPLAVVVTRRDLLDRFVRTDRYFNTFGGNPVVCAAGLAVLEVLEREGLQENALMVGRYLRERLSALMARHPIIGDVRGTGLFAGIEIVDAGGTDGPDPARARALIEHLLSRNVLVGITGPGRNLLKIRPPMCFSRANADTLVSALDDSLAAVAAS